MERRSFRSEQKIVFFYTAWKNLTLKGVKVDESKNVYNQQIAHIKKQKTLLHVSAMLFGHPQGVSILKDVYSLIIRNCLM